MKKIHLLIFLLIHISSNSFAQNKFNESINTLFKTEYNCLRIHLSKDSIESDEAVVRFMDGKSDAFNPSEDVIKPLMNPGVNISSYFSPNTYCMVNYLNINSMKSIKVPLAAWVDEIGTYSLFFDQTKDFDNNIIIQLKDYYNNTLSDIRANNSYNFNVDEKIESTADGRLELWFSSKTNAIESKQFYTKQISFYPNPVEDNLFIDISDSHLEDYIVKIYNELGVEMESQKFNTNIMAINTMKYKEGLYFIRIFSNEESLLKTANFIRKTN
jgi:hypothetical protein